MRQSGHKDSADCITPKSLFPLPFRNPIRPDISINWFTKKIRQKIPISTESIKMKLKQRLQNLISVVIFYHNYDKLEKADNTGQKI